MLIVEVGFKLDNDFKYCTKADGECYQCVSGAYLGEDKKCSLSRNCAESKNGICTYCITGYHLGIDNLCNDIDKCLRTNNYNSCEECEKESIVKIVRDMVQMIQLFHGD